MTKINHDRPALRLLDNYRRELKRQAIGGTRSTDIESKTKIDNPMPNVDRHACELILLVFDAASEYYDNYAYFLDSINPNASRSYRRKKQILKQNLEIAKNKLVDTCVQLIMEAMRETLKGEHGIVTWLNWLEKEAQKPDNYALRDILELGFRPAFAKVDTAKNEI